MTQKDSHSDTATFSAAALAPPMLNPELLDLAKRRMDALLEVQKEFMATLEDIHHEMFDRARAQAELTSEFVNKLSAVRSVPDATTTYREWANRELELLAEDGRHLFANGEKIMQASRRLFGRNGA
jgi:phasin protein